MKKIKALFAICIILFAFFPKSALAADLNLRLEADSAILIDLSTGKVLYAKNENERHFPASTTKMLTAILAIENLNLDKKLTMDDEVHAARGSVLGLKNGEVISVKDLLFSMLVRSANDCAVALAKEVSGSVEAFSALMNKKAKEFGCTGSYFVNPNGLHDEKHYSTAADLSKIAFYCMKNDIFRDAVSKVTYTVPATNLSEARTVVSTNLLLYDEKDENKIYVDNDLRYCKYEGCIGVKTGYTDAAGGCLVAAAKKGGTELLSVVLHSSAFGRFADSIKLLDSGFTNYRTESVMAGGTPLGFIKVKRGAVRKAPVELSTDVKVTVPSEAAGSVITTKTVLDKFAVAPLKAGTVVGSLKLFESGIEAGSFDIIASEDVEKGGPLSIVGIPDKTAKIMLFSILGIFAAIIMGFIIWLAYLKHQMKIKKARRDAKRKARRLEEEKRRAEWEAEYERLRHTGDEGGGSDDYYDN